METLGFVAVLLIAIILLIASTFIFTSSNDEGATFVSVICALVSGCLFCYLTYDYAKTSEQVNKQPKLINYKVRELEKNTVFTITDSIGGYNMPRRLLINGNNKDVFDTVWVNMNTRKIDTKDSTAMMCVIVNLIE